MSIKGLRGSIVVLAVLIVSAALTGCGTDEPTPEERVAVETAVRGYLDGLAQAYETLDMRHLDEYASPVEIRNVRNLLQQLANSGDRVEATLVLFEVTGVDIFRDVNASVGLVEVWDLVRFDALTGHEKGRTDGSVQTTLIQLRRIEGDWKVIGRHIVDRETGSTIEEEGAQG